MVDLGIIEKSSLLHRIAEHLGYDYVSELPVQFPGEAIAALTGKLARDYGVMPLNADAQNILQGASLAQQQEERDNDDNQPLMTHHCHGVLSMCGARVDSLED